MYIDMIQAMRDMLRTLNTVMQESLGTTLPFSLATVPPDDVFHRDLRECMYFLISDLREFSEYLPEEDATDPNMKLDPVMAGLSYYINLAMIIGRRS